MPYTKSRARKDFDTQVNDLIRAVKEAHTEKCSVPSVRELVLCSAVMLTMARLEVYLQDVVSDWSARLNEVAPAVGVLPGPMRAHALVDDGLQQSFKTYLLGGDEKRLLREVVTRLDCDHPFGFATHSTKMPKLYASRFTSRRKYPSPDNLESLFFRIGIEQVLSEMSKRARADMRKRLQSFNDIRTALAHEGELSGINESDIICKLKEMMHFVYHLDKVMYCHVVGCSGAASWTV